MTFPSNFGTPDFSIGGTRHLASGPGIRITKCFIHETGTYNPQFRRPYQTCLTGNGLGAIQERLHGMTRFDASSMGGIANQFIQPAAAPEKMIEIPHGWSDQRLRFMLEVEYTEPIGTKTKELILGYTSHHGITHTGAIDPQMEFYVNSVIQIRDKIVPTQFGNQQQASVINSSHVLVDNNFAGIYNNTGGDQWIRPEDVYVVMNRSHLEGYNPGETLFDARNSARRMAVKSRRSNCLATNYMATVLEGYNSALRESSAFNAMPTQEDIFTKARSHTQEAVAARDFFLSAIANLRNMPVGNTFRWGELLQLDPDAERNTRAVLMAPVEKAQVHWAGQTADWGAVDRSTVVATILSHAVPGLLMDLGLTQIAFTATNRTIGCQDILSIQNVQGFSQNIDLTPFAQAFEIRMRNEVIRDISYDNQTDYHIDMIVDLIGETRIRVSVDNQPATDYTAPSFCDALSAPIATCNQGLTQTMASDFDSLVNLVADQSSNTSTAGLGTFGKF